MNIPFQDISYAQGAYNMSANTDQLIAIRMSSGDGGLHFDTQGQTNYNNASAAGKTIIGYHFAGTGNPTTEANFFIEAMSPFAEGDIYALDIELGQSASWINTFVERVQAVTGCWPLVYLNIATANSLWSGVNSNCALWLSAPSWGFDQTITELSAGIVYAAQQGPEIMTAASSVVVDQDVFFAVDLNHVKAYGYKVPAIAPTPAPEVPEPAPVAVSDPTPESAPVPVIAPVTPLPDPGTVITPIPSPASDDNISIPVTVVPKPEQPVVNIVSQSFWQKLVAWLRSVI